MRPRRTPASNQVFRLPGGNEDNDLWLTNVELEGHPVLVSVWELSDEERARIAAGDNIQLLVWGPGHPPVQLATTDIALGRG